MTKILTFLFVLFGFTGKEKKAFKRNTKYWKNDSIAVVFTKIFLIWCQGGEKSERAGRWNV